MSDATPFRIVRTQSFWDDDFITLVNDSTLYDNNGNIMASRDYHIFPEASRYIPLIIKDDDDVPKGIHFDGRVYWISVVCDHIEHWYDVGAITLDQRNLIGDILAILCHENLAWDLNYFWPNVYMPYICRTRLQSCNLGTFLDQFPSDPYVIDLVGDSETIDTDPLTSLGDFQFDMETFDWEHLNDVIMDLFE